LRLASKRLKPFATDFLAEPLREYGIKLQEDLDYYLAVKGYYNARERRWLRFDLLETPAC
jgi:hypothetical protein